MPRLTDSVPAIRIGILGGANIAKQFIRDVAASDRVDVVAVASRTPERAATFAAALGVGRAHGSYEALLDDREVDVVYLPAEQHACRVGDQGRGARQARALREANRARRCRGAAFIKRSRR